MRMTDDDEIPNTFKLPGESDDDWIDRITGATPNPPPPSIEQGE
jgi:hypothetical protein